MSVLIQTSVLLLQIWYLILAYYSVSLLEVLINIQECQGGIRCLASIVVTEQLIEERSKVCHGKDSFVQRSQDTWRACAIFKSL